MVYWGEIMFNSNFKLCDNKSCPLQFECGRFTEKPGEGSQAFKWEIGTDGKAICGEYVAPLKKAYVDRGGQKYQLGIDGDKIVSVSIERGLGWYDPATASETEDFLGKTLEGV